MLCCAAPLRAQYSDPLVERGFDHFYNLEYGRALAAFEKAAERAPDSPHLHNNIALALLFGEMYRNGALETELVSGNNPFLRRPKMNPPHDVVHRFEDEIAAAIELSQKKIAEDQKDTGALYALGIAHGLRANFNYLVHKAWRDALRDATAARKAHNRITELDPANVDARLIQGIHEYIVGSLPLVYRMLGFLAGYRGDKDKGIRIIEEVARKGRYNQVDAQIFLCALYRREGRPKQALELIGGLLRRYPRNHLLRFEESQMYSQAGDKEHALASMERISELKKSGADGYTGIAWEKIWYQTGTIRFWYRDYEEALEDFKRVAAHPEAVDVNSAVLAYMRLGQIHDVLGHRSQALESYNKALEFAPGSEPARESRRYIASPYRRDEK